MGGVIGSGDRRRGTLRGRSAAPSGLCSFVNDCGAPKTTAEAVNKMAERCSSRIKVSLTRLFNWAFRASLAQRNRTFNYPLSTFQREQHELS